MEELKAREAAVANRDAEMEKVAREQATERGRLNKPKEEVEAAQASHTKLVSDEKAWLGAREKLLARAEEAAAVRRDAIVSLEMRSRKALQDLFGGEHKEPMATPE